MKITKKDLGRAQVEMRVELDAEDIKPYLADSARHISQHMNIAGFRPGKAPYDVVKREVGEEKIFTEGLDEIINRSLISAMKQEDVYPYGDPNLNLEKIIPLQEIVYSVKMDVYPEVKLGDWPTGKVKRQAPEVSKDEIEKAVKELTKMLVKEELVERAAENGDSAIVDFDVLVNGVPIEGGSAKDFSIVIGEGKMIPGFEEQVEGMKAGENKDFKLKFPTDYKPDLANKEADFKIAVKQVLERKEPAIDDALAKRLGVETKDELYKRMEDNLKAEKDDKERQRAEIEAVKKVVDASSVSEMPAKMIHDEVHRLLHEFEHDLSRQGAEMSTYLANIGKKKEDLEREFEPRAIERLKTSLVVDAVVEQEKLEVNEKEVEGEWEKQKQFYGNQPKVLEQVKNPDYRRHLRARMLKIKAIDIITDKLVEK
jgi:trigger factor